VTIKDEKVTDGEKPHPNIRKERAKKDIHLKTKETQTTGKNQRTFRTFDFFPRLLRVLVNEVFMPSM